MTPRRPSGPAPGTVLQVAGVDRAQPSPLASRVLQHAHEELAARALPGSPPFTPQMARGMSEATLQRNILSLATVTLDWLGYHTHDSRRSQPGFPDLVLVSARQKRVLFTELKTERGRQSINQQQWERELRETGLGEFYLWRPTHWLSGEIPRILRRCPA